MAGTYNMSDVPTFYESRYEASSAIEHGAEKIARALLARRAEDARRRILLDDHAVIHEDDARADLPRKVHLVRHHQHRDAARRKIAHHREHFGHEPGGEGARHLVDQ